MKTNKIILLLIVFFFQVISIIAEAQRANIPYETSFETWNTFPDNNNYWETNNNEPAITDIIIEDAFHGNKSLKLYSDMPTCMNCYPGDCISSAELKLDLSGENNILLDLAWKAIYTINENSSDPTDCCERINYCNNDRSTNALFFSDDDGENYTKVLQFSIYDNNWNTSSINLSDIALQNNLELNDQFKIKFQFHCVRGIFDIHTYCYYDIHLLLDNIAIYNGCPVSYSFTNTSNLHIDPNIKGRYSAQEFIMAGQNVVIQPNTTVRFGANNYIKLTDGFHAEKNCNFKANLNGCGNNLKSFKLKEPLLVDTSHDSTPAQLDVNIYPNPSPGIINISTEKALENATITVSDLTGKVIYNKCYTNTQKVRIDLNGHPEGMYIIRITTEQGSVFKKVILN